MNILRYATFAIAVLLCFQIAAQKIKPVNPEASPRAIKLLEFVDSISGKNIVAGQHCAPLVGSTRLSVVHRTTKHYPALFGQDFGFDMPGYWDGINYRQRIVDEAIKRHSEGFIITIMWHAVPPTKDEPVDFKEAIQSDLTDKEWQDLVTPGTLLNERWKSQVDVIAWFLKQLRYAEVPVLWRPYHEMNGDWFWWGKKKGDNGYKKLWRMLYERLVKFHSLNNLIWVYNCNEVKPGVDAYATYYPGDDVVDILATDVYTEGFNQSNYDELVALARKKPVALGEVGNLPTLDIIKRQPRWAWFMNWGEPIGYGKDFDNVLDVYNSKPALTLEELPWNKAVNFKLHYPLLK